LKTVIIILFCVTILLNIVILGKLAAKKRDDNNHIIAPVINDGISVPVVSKTAGQPCDIVAAITVAISMYLENEAKDAGIPRAGFVVKSIYQTKNQRRRG
jgi:hypothetical protein